MFSLFPPLLIRVPEAPCRQGGCARPPSLCADPRVPLRAPHTPHAADGCCFVPQGSAGHFFFFYSAGRNEFIALEKTPKNTGKHLRTR